MNKSIFYTCCSVLTTLFTSAVFSEQYLTLDLTGMDRNIQSQDFSCLGNNCNNNPSQTIVLKSTDSNFKLEPSASIAYGRDTHRGRAEFRGTYYGHWKGSRNKIDAGEDLNPIRDLMSDDDDFTDSYSHKITYDSTLWGAEMLLSRELSRNRKFTYGLSYLDLNENFNWNTVDEMGDLPGVNGNANYDLSTSNKLYGVVVGLEGLLKDLGPKATITYGVKGGLYVNNREQSGRIENDVSTTPDIGQGSRSDSGASGLLEAKIGVDYKINKTSTINLGIKGTYLSNVALAPDQVTFGTEAPGPLLDERLSHIVETGNLTLYGISLNFTKYF